MNPEPIEDFGTAPWPLPVWQEPMTREQYEREQIADAKSTLPDGAECDEQDL